MTFLVLIEKGKCYKLVDTDYIGYKVIDERDDTPKWYSHKFFESIEESRDRKLKELL
jgi:hypothetical protein